MTHPFVHRRKPAPGRRHNTSAEVERVRRRFAIHELELPPFALRNMRPEVLREFHEADREGRGKPT